MDTSIRIRCIPLLLLLLLLIIFGFKANAVELSEDERILIQQVAIAEANNQGVGGMAFVMQTILNRIENPDFPNTLYDVIYQKGQFDVADKNLEDIKTTNNSQTALEYAYILQNRGQLYFENNHGRSDTWHRNNLNYAFSHLDHDFYY